MSYELHKTLTGKDQPYCDVSFSPDGNHLAASKKNGVISGIYLDLLYLRPLIEFTKNI